MKKVRNTIEGDTEEKKEGTGIKENNYGKNTRGKKRNSNIQELSLCKITMIRHKINKYK